MNTEIHRRRGSVTGKAEETVAREFDLSVGTARGHIGLRVDSVEMAGIVESVAAGRAHVTVHAWHTDIALLAVVAHCASEALVTLGTGGSPVEIRLSLDSLHAMVALEALLSWKYEHQISSAMLVIESTFLSLVSSVP